MFDAGDEVLVAAPVGSSAGFKSGYTPADLFTETLGDAAGKPDPDGIATCRAIWILLLHPGEGRSSSIRPHRQALRRRAIGRSNSNWVGVHARFS